MKEIKHMIQSQRQFYQSNETHSLTFRLNQLKKLKKAIEEYEPHIIDALRQDLGKSDAEAYMTEIGIIYHEINTFIKKLPKWMKKQKVRTPLMHQPGKSFIKSEPYGVTLIIAPWNYPFQLAIAPLIGAIAGGNTAVIKPSEHSNHTSEVIYDLIHKTFDEAYITTVLGGVDVNTELLKQQFDYIFFTGSVPVGKIVMEAAAKHLTPVTLELGGKSPAVVTQSANVKLAAKRIVFGKLINSGQTCVAPDYVLIHESVKKDFVHYVAKYIKEFYGEDVLNHESFPRIINENHFNRLTGYLKDQTFLIGGNYNVETLKIAPTLLDEVSLEDDVMKDEIFGPILPLISFTSIEDAIQIIKDQDRPLALYLFTNDKELEKRFINTIPFGGGCINDTLFHVAHQNLPFGGIGSSGMGAYHGKASFDTFTHKKSIFKQSNKIDINFKYPPYEEKKLKWIKKFLK